MIPGKLDLPTIWRGCNWGPVTFKWKDQNGNPIGLAGWTPKAHTLNFDLHALIQNYGLGIVTLSLTKEQTGVLRLGVEQWDWIWEQGSGTSLYRYPPILSGRVAIKEPVSTSLLHLPPTAAPSLAQNGSSPIDVVPRRLTSLDLK